MNNFSKEVQQLNK